MPSSHQKVIVRKMDRDSVSGYVSPLFIVDGKLELLNTAGKVIKIDVEEIKGVYFVRDFSGSETPQRKTFTTRPRTAGLWVRVRFRDNEAIEGLMPDDLMQTPENGFLIIPPDSRTNTHRIFVPRQALSSVTVLAVIGGPSSRRRRPPAGDIDSDSAQVQLFSE